MNSSIISQVARPAMSAMTKRTMIRSFSCTPTKSFNVEDPKYQLEQVHHQVAPLTDATIYAPQGSSVAEMQASKNESIVFTPSVNAVFDE